ncbi:MAG: hypothetical protein ACTHLD_13935 [Chitinophaga sp.]
MKKQFLFALAFMLAVNVAAFAQQGGGNGQRRTPEERAKMTVERLTKQLQLNNDQAVKLGTVYTEFYKDMQKKREEAQAGGNRMDREAFQKMGNERDEKVKTVLTEEQFKKYKEQMEAMRQRGSRGGGGGNR